MQKEIVRTQVRFPVEIMESLKRWAKDDGRSLNSFLLQMAKEEKERRENNASEK
ncbi:Arc family DNA-binding protein [Entomomonas moraniae]|uniref:Arc family DNA-binding protein n=1 Tax=Entomomonas moraniae TaxID=2213226 RepID=A0A3Q9JNA8_9GAMM|nr:Arc family DNA-binding protein [Entomomonas moraniae]AZS50643.1 Arc family DNA-binding protein [Entomomonas moraniae]